MVNALKLASLFIYHLPGEISPENTSEREGFIHPIELKGSAEKATIRLILRDFELEGLEEKKKFLINLVEKLQKQEPRASWNISITPQYRNMRYWLDKDPFSVEGALEAVKRVGLTPFTQPIRGGTDGSYLTENGLSTPNIFVGFHNMHSPKEWVCLQDMVLSVKTLVHLAQVWEEKEL